MRSALKLAIIEKGLPQYEIAKRLRTTETRLSRIVLGRLEPSPEERRLLAEVLDVDESRLFAPSGGGR